MAIGENIKMLRLKCKMTQEKLADELKVTQSLIAHIERGSRNPSIQLCKDIAKVLNCKLEDLVS